MWPNQSFCQTWRYCRKKIAQKFALPLPFSKHCPK
jgi:hypothetical protein